MPIAYARRLTGKDRSADSNRHLGFALTFVAGAINAGGFLAIHQYTSHMTGIVSALADNVVLGASDLLIPGIGALASFTFGALCTAVIVNVSKARHLHSSYALPLLFEAGLLLCFGAIGSKVSASPSFVPGTMMLLCFIMGLQNAVITKVSRAEIRTTHLTGVITDIGIEMGRWVYGATAGRGGAVAVDRARLQMLSTLAASFFAGGLFGGWSFQAVGYSATLPLAALLAASAIVPAIDDLRTLAVRS